MMRLFDDGQIIRTYAKEMARETIRAATSLVDA